MIRKAIKAGEVQSVPHRWGTRVSRADVVRLARQVANPPHRDASLSRSIALADSMTRRRQAFEIPASDDQLERTLLAVVGELGPAPLAQIYDALVPRYNATFPDVVYALRRLHKQHKVKRSKGERGDIYEL